jgi:hypothetical protein
MGEKSCWVSEWISREQAIIRPCLHCGEQFLSPGSGIRVCRGCRKKEDDARSRPFSKREGPEESLNALIEDIFDESLFDPELLAYRREYEAKRAAARKRRSARYRKLRANQNGHGCS